MKLIKTLVYTLIVCVSLVSHAEAKGRTASFKGGFSSQVRSVSKPAPVYYKSPVNSPNKAATFGAFGGAKVNAAQNGMPSQMSRDLNTNAAQANALKTADARNNINLNNSANPPTGGNGGGGGWFRSGNNNAAPQQSNYSQPLYSQPGHQTIVHQNSGGFMHGLMWFMIGRSTVSQNNTVYVPVNNQAASAQAVNTQVVNPNDGSSWDANGTTQQRVAPIEEKESFFTKIFRWMLWIGFIWGIIWVVRKVMGFRNSKLNRATNYSLRS